MSIKLIRSKTQQCVSKGVTFNWRLLVGIVSCLVQTIESIVDVNKRKCVIGECCRNRNGVNSLVAMRDGMFHCKPDARAQSISIVHRIHREPCFYLEKKTILSRTTGATHTI